jgi:sphingomyelin phosphodiesterase acid-like 3
LKFSKSLRRNAVLFGLSIVCAAVLCRAANAEPPAAGRFLIMSDLHFDPMADPRLVDGLVASDPEQWKSILETSNDKSLGRYGRDTNWMLLRSTLAQVKETLADPDFVLISGDFLAHDFRREFNAAASDHSDAAYRIFVRKTMQFLGQRLKQTFPVTPILPTLGNNDEECGDYQLQPKGPFLADTLPLLHALVGDSEPDLDETWTSYGNYRGKVRGIRILSTNTNFFSIHYRNACGAANDADPGRATFAWLERALAMAKAAQEPVWLLYHIPPGIDGFATLRQGACPTNMIPMWDDVYGEAYDALLRRYADTVVAGFAGHTHMDDFRPVGTADTHSAFTLITPAVSPIFGQNPAFRIVLYDASGVILDQTTYALINLTEATATNGVPPEWRAEYTFTSEWHLPRVDLPSLDRLYSLTQKEPAERERWHTLFPVSSPKYWAPFSGGNEQLAQAVRAFHCATGNVFPGDYQQCYCSGD